MAVESGVSLALAQLRAANLSDIQYQLHFEIPEQQSAAIPARISIRFLLKSKDEDLQLDFRSDPDAIHSVTANGLAGAYQYREEHLIISADTLEIGQNQIDIEFTAGESSLNRNPQFLYTLFVPDRARTAFPLFDQPDLKARYQLTLDIPDSWTAISNAPLQATEPVNGATRYRFATTKPISSYLFSFVAGEFERITRKIGERDVSMLHRETDTEKVRRNTQAIFELHTQALNWLEAYTGIPYPFEKLDFALLPAFQYGGMEHTGAIQYRASSLMLEASATESQLLNRASLIAHEVAHMWFGNLVTMKWFNDVWTKEVFANFMAAKIVNPAFPAINHDLNFLVRHYPGAYGVDRSAGANPIRQHLDNLNQAGQMYGAIIYQKAPIMMRQLELIVGEQAFRESLQEYLRNYAFSNADWPGLIAILDTKSKVDLKQWSEVWVNTPGRPYFTLERTDNGNAVIRQTDNSGANRVWPQMFSLLALPKTQGSKTLAPKTKSSAARISSRSRDTAIPGEVLQAPSQASLLNADGMGYGLFPAEMAALQYWDQMSDLEQGSTLINLYDSLLEGQITDTRAYVSALLEIISKETNQLLLDLALYQLHLLYSSFLAEELQQQLREPVETILWQTLAATDHAGRKRLLFATYSSLASSEMAIAKVQAVWSGETAIELLPLSESDNIRLAQILAIRLPEKSTDIVATELARIKNPDNRRKLEFVSPTLTADTKTHDAFFDSLAAEENRRTENWVLQALRNLHHPSRRQHAEKYLQPSLELLEEIQETGDIFFPAGWLRANLQNHHSDRAIEIAQEFLAQRPNYNPQLRMKILQALDVPQRANRSRARQQH